MASKLEHYALIGDCPDRGPGRARRRVRSRTERSNPERV